METFYFEDMDHRRKNTPKADWTHYNWFWHGIKAGYGTCCIFFFMNVWGDCLSKKENKDIKRSWTSTGDGYIPCPDCLARLMREEKLANEVEDRCDLSDIEKDILIQNIRS